MCEHEDHQHDVNFLKETWYVIVALILFISTISFQYQNDLKVIILILAYLLAGSGVLLTALKNIFKGDFFDENFLMGVATLGAIAIGEYPEAVMVMVLYQIGEYLQHRAVHRTRKSITDLMNIKPEYANVEENNAVTQKSPEEVKINDIIIVKTGEKIPLDGTIIDGCAYIDTSALTGEAVPREVKINDKALSGCINTDGYLKIKVTKEYSESTVSKILELVEHAKNKKTKTEKFITKFARYYTPSVVAAALILATIPPIITGTGFLIWTERALTFLVISCPCALVISIPLGFFAGIGAASKNGILIKGSNYLEALSKPDSIAFDKTGTLTKGNFVVNDIIPENGATEDDLLKYAATAEIYSNHPIATAIKNKYNKTIDKNTIQEIKEEAGNGIIANISGDTILAGNSKLMANHNIEFFENLDANTVVYVAKNKTFIGTITITDEVKEGSKSAIYKLKKLACKVIMLTGDSTAVAEKTAKNLGIDIVYSQLLPKDKVDKIEKLIDNKHKNGSVIFVGDGINDAPVLKRSDIGIAMGGLGSDAAIEAADIVIMDDDPTRIPTAIKIAKNTMRIVKQNIIFAIGIKILFLILGAFGYMSMWGAVFADVGVTLIAILNALRILLITKKERS